MAYVSSFVYCDNIQVQMTPQGPRNQIINPLQILMPIAIPGNYSFAVACNVMGFDAEQENSIQLQFVSPSGDVVFDTQLINIQLPEDSNKQSKPDTIQFNLDLRNIVIKEAGIHTTRVIVNQTYIGEYKIQVIEGEL